ncbi:dephospho-CoA kinase [Oscillospiraceae bacterium WX1]
MTIIGITGPSGVGKTSALRALASLGAEVVDCDAVYHALLQSDGALIQKLGKRFDGVVQSGCLNRRALGQIVFNDPAALCDLNDIAHAFVKDEVSRRLLQWENAGSPLAAIDAVALIESGMAPLCTIVVGIIAPLEARIKRIMARDGITESEALMRIRAQKPDSFYKEHCDYMLYSNGDTVEDFENTCRAFFSRLLGGADHA